MKIFKTSEDVLDLALNKFEETSLSELGINLKVLSTSKAKNVLKVSRANAILNNLTNNDIILVIYEEAFDRLNDEHKEKLLEGCLSNVSYDSEKDKLNVDGDIAREIFRMRRKYPEYVDILEASYIAIEQIEEEEKERKEAEKLTKKAKKQNN